MTPQATGAVITVMAATALMPNAMHASAVGSFMPNVAANSAQSNLVAMNDTYAPTPADFPERREGGGDQTPPRTVAIAAPASVALWHLVVAQLDTTQHGWSTGELATLLGIESRTVTYWCRKLFPNDNGERHVYWLDFDQAVDVIRRVCKEGRKVPDRNELYGQLIIRGVITLGFPADSPAMHLAEMHLAEKLSQRLQQRAKEAATHSAAA